MNLNDPSVMDKSLRSVFVGNIPYEATEEKLKDIFSEVGPVTSFKLVYDRETGKPKGYGFCEYKDQETALSAMRNLNGREIAGRTLRVDNACTEKSRMEMQTLMAGPTQEDSPYGPPVEPSRAPETIGKAVASLPPEQMFQLMQQMKMCIQNNPQEARTMLLQNPQLAYALLQAQVVMRIVDPETAVTMLHKTAPSVAPIGIPPSRPAAPLSATPSQMSASSSGPLPVPPPGGTQGFNPPFPGGNRVSMERSSFPDDVRGGSGGGGPLPPRDPRNRERNSAVPIMESRGGARQGPPMGGMQRPNMSGGPPVREHSGTPSREHSGPPRDHREHSGPPPGRGGPIQQLPPHLAGADPEKAQLIMQVLQLTDEQIAMLPPEQRQSILVLKEQINQGR